MASRVRFVAWLLSLLLALFPILATTADLASDLSSGLPNDHDATFAVVVGESCASA
jgi:hypothetical protein